MPRIEILEQDLTRGTSAAGTDIAFIPGFVKETQYSYRKKLSHETGTHRYDLETKTYISDASGNYVQEIATIYEQPVYCASKEAFESIFGKDPYIFTAANQVGENVTITAGTPDRSYIMAKELLSLGMPIYYYGIQCDDELVSFSNIIEGIDAGDFSIPGNTITVDTPLTESKTITINVSSTIKPNDILNIEVLNTDTYIAVISTPILDASNKYTGSTDINAITATISCREGKTSIAGDLIKLKITLNRQGTSTTADTRLTSFYATLSDVFSNGELEDRDEYTIKYITTGGYPNIEVGEPCELAQKMLNLAYNRGDAVALIESYDEDTRSLSPNGTSFYNALQTASLTNDEYGAAFTPWSKFNLINNYKVSDERKISQELMPACFGYLADLASNIKVSPNWLAMAGTTRGLVPNIVSLNTTQRLSNVIANAYQPTTAEGSGNTRALNAITKINPYGLCIWGNRTLKAIGEEGLVGTNFLNTRNMISDIKKVAYRAAKGQLFEQNSEVLWLNFKAEVSPFLEQLKKGNGIADYKLLKLSTHYNGSSLGKEEFACAIKIYPLYAVESFEITIVVSDNDVSVG